MQRRHLLPNPLAKNLRPSIYLASDQSSKGRQEVGISVRKSLSNGEGSTLYIQYSIFGVSVYLPYVLTSPTSYCYLRLRPLPPSLKQYLAGRRPSTTYLPQLCIHYTIQYTSSHILSSLLLLMNPVFFSKQLFFSFLIIIIIIISIIVESQTLPKFLALWMLSLLDKGCESDDDV